VPANGTALIKRPLPGHELACGAHEADFDVSGAAGSRGVVSYYATSTMVEAATFESWLDLIERKSSGDLAQGRITELHKPTLQIYGNPNTKLPGCRVDLLATALDK
jgi:hypothetical protein